MENGIHNFQSVEVPHSLGPTSVSDDKKLVEEDVNNQSFVNEAAISWKKMRQEWLGERANRPCRRSQESSISWCTTYEDLLSSNQPFPQPIPLSEMVDFLVDIWQEEGLYD